MDTHAALIIFAITALIILPFFINSQNKKRKHKKFQNEFLKLAQEESIKLSQKDYYHYRYAIGIDEASGKIIYAKSHDNEIKHTVVDLAETQKCRIVATDKTVKSQNAKNNLTDRLELVLTSRNSQDEQFLEFYENANFMPNEDDHSHVEKWSRIINSYLKNSSN